MVHTKPMQEFYADKYLWNFSINENNIALKAGFNIMIITIIIKQMTIMIMTPFYL